MHLQLKLIPNIYSFQMNSFFKTCLLLTYVSISIQINIQTDFELNGLILHKFQDVYAQTNEQYLTYKFNASILENVNEHRSYIESRCPQKATLLFGSQFEFHLIQLNINWKKRIRIENSGISISIFPEIFMDLHGKIEKFSASNCDILDEVSIKVYKINEILNEMASFNFESINYFIPPEMIQNDIWRIIKQIEGKTSFPLNKRAIIHEIEKYANFKLYHMNNIIAIEIKIPFFEEKTAELYTINRKPVVWENNAYLFNDSYQYALINSNRTLLYTEENFRENCFKIKKINILQSH